MWTHGDWVKNLILFFDGIALLVPDYMRDRPYELDPALVAGLQETGLLAILEPETFIDRPAAESLATALTGFIASGALDSLPETSEYHALSRSRLGYMADPGLADMLIDELRARGLAQPSADGVSIPLHPLVRYLVLVLLAQILRPTGRDSGLDLAPATDRPEIQQALGQFLELPAMPSAGHVVARDLETVSVDLGPVPLDEVLDFRAAHGDEFQRYARDLRAFTRGLHGVSEAERDQALEDRAAELAATAEALRTTARKAWKRPLAFGLGIAGATGRVAEGDVIGGLLALGAAGIAATSASSRNVGPGIASVRRPG
jgi:hypothetical protein